MPEFDLTFTMTGIIALCAIISPIFTSIVNNIHQTKLKKMELAEQRFSNTVMHKRDIFENYLNCVGRCVNHPDASALKDYGEYYFSALMYAPLDLRDEMIAANHCINESDFVRATKIIEGLTPKIHALLQLK